MELLAFQKLNLGKADTVSGWFLKLDGWGSSCFGWSLTPQRNRYAACGVLLDPITSSGGLDILSYGTI